MLGTQEVAACGAAQASLERIDRPTGSQWITLVTEGVEVPDFLVARTLSSQFCMKPSFLGSWTQF